MEPAAEADATKAELVAETERPGVLALPKSTRTPAVRRLLYATRCADFSQMEGIINQLFNCSCSCYVLHVVGRYVTTA